MMKKTIYLIIMLIFSTAPLYAIETGNIIIYPNAGLGTTTGVIETMSKSSFEKLDWVEEGTFRDNPAYYTTKAFSWSIGVMFDYMVKDYLSIVSGISYDVLPYESRYPLADSDKYFLLRYDFSFITVPLGLRLYTKNSFVLGGGAYYGYMVSDSLTTENSADAGIDKKDLRDQIGGTKNDFGIFLDFGYNIRTSESGAILLLCRYKHGFPGVYGNPDPVTRLKMRTLTFNLGYGFIL